MAIFTDQHPVTRIILKDKLALTYSSSLQSVGISKKKKNYIENYSFPYEAFETFTRCAVACRLIS